MTQTTQQYHLFYKTIRPSTGEYYYGIHSTSNLHDGYHGSGNRIKSLIRSGAFLITGTICEHTTRSEALYHEATIVTQEMLSDPLCLNLIRGGNGAEMTFACREDTKVKISKANANPSVEARALISSVHKGKTVTTVTRKRQSLAKSKGWFVTPAGTFLTAVKAAKATGYSDVSVTLWCKTQRDGYYYIPKT